MEKGTDAPLHFTGNVGQRPGEQKVIPVVVVVISSLTVGEVTIRIIWVGRMVSTDGRANQFEPVENTVCFQNVMQNVCV